MADRDVRSEAGPPEPVTAPQVPALSTGVAIDPSEGSCCHKALDARPKGSRACAKRKRSSLLIPLAVLCTFTILFVGWEVVERFLFPHMTTGLRHALLTVRAAVVTTAASSIVYVLMRRQNQQLSTTAEQLSRLLESHHKDAPGAHRFENPHLRHCRDVLSCDRTDCPMYDASGERCWQVMALSRAPLGDRVAPIEIEKCHECSVYRLSCPDRLTELGENFNSLMFLLGEEDKQVGQMRTQLAEKEKMVAIGQIAAGVAHEVGNPLSSISSIVQMLKRQAAFASATDQLDLVQTHIHRISTIVRHLVTMARPTAERWQAVDVGQILEEAIRLITFDKRAKHVTIDFLGAHALPPTFALKEQLGQVFINLLINALDAMPDGGQLTVRAEAHRGGIAVRIRDTGSGIASEAGRRVFEPFFTTKEPGHGTGLGLAVSYGIIQKHNGVIDFHSAPSEGTEFTVHIPVLDKAPQRG